jgi:hypothetical protein
MANNVVDPDPGSGALTPGSRIRDGKKSENGSGDEHPRSFPESLDIVFWVKILLIRIRNLFDPDPGFRDLGRKNSHPGTQHC